MKLRSVIAIFGATLVLSGCSTSTPAVNDATWSKGACDETTAGVTVSVDFKGQVSTHCAISYQGDSWKLLKAAGF
ncbi:MAG: hypothetical protein RLZZ603_945, partial [Actinomycetota bacterium]